MRKYKIDYDEVAETNALVLIEAVARYMSSSDYPNVADIASILGIKEEENSYWCSMKVSDRKRGRWLQKKRRLTMHWSGVFTELWKIRRSSDQC